MDITLELAKQKLPEHIWIKISVEGDGCWKWHGYRNVGGYGVIRAGGFNQVAHRLIYKRLVGPIGRGLVLDHLCRVRRCVNPLHLEPVSQRENVLRGKAQQAINARKTHCLNGHPFSEENTHLTKRNQRQCKICKRNRLRKSSAIKYEKHRRLGLCLFCNEPVALGRVMCQKHLDKHNEYARKGLSWKERYGSKSPDGGKRVKKSTGRPRVS